jgi:murein DD-endopeptidase MepM/ murein hydrolase activator NlpD
VSVDVAAIVERAKIAATEARKDGQISATDREKLTRVAAEFESMLLLQMLRDMRKAGSWDDGESEKDSLGAESLVETLDVELASHRARAQGLGLSDQMLGAFDRLQPATMPVAPTTESVAKPSASVEASALRYQGPEPRAQSPEAFVKPVSGSVTSEFGWRRDPFTQRMKFHQGVDMKAAYGQDVKAAGAGRVVFSGEAGGYGTSVVIEHQDGTRTRYAHLSATLVEKGDAVGAGEAVGRAGRSGRATGTHLHFEVIGRDGRRMEPQLWARADANGRALPSMDERRTEQSGD